MKIEIVREKRKTICLKVESSERAALKAPMRISERKIDEFLSQKRGWLEKTAQKMRMDENFEHDLHADERAYLHGKCVGEFREMIAGFDQMTDEKKKKEVKKFYLSHFFEFEERVKQLSLMTKISYSSLKPTASRRIWGSFSRKNEMKLNYLLIFLPDDLIDYVIIHELCHKLQMNHSPKFWAEVSHYVKDYKARKKELSKFSFLLRK